MTNEMFFDTDCISSFLWINNTNLLHELYGGKIVLPEPVYNELSNPRVPQLKGRADELIASKDAFVQAIEVGTEEYKLYSSLLQEEEGKKSIGRGEAAGIALAKTYNGVLASNNYADAAEYIEKYNLKHIDTGHILKEALEKGLITEEDGNGVLSRLSLLSNIKKEVVIDEKFKANIKKSGICSFCRTLWLVIELLLIIFLLPY